MRPLIVIILSLMVLSSCTMPWSQSTSPANIEYSKTQSGSPASLYCTSKGGQVSYEKNPNIPTMDLIYCTIGGDKIDAWKYMDIQTTATGAMTASGIPL